MERWVSLMLGVVSSWENREISLSPSWRSLRTSFLLYMASIFLMVISRYSKDWSLETTC